MEIITHLYPQIISVENLLAAWREFYQDKKRKIDVRIFAQHLLPNILSLHDELTHFAYKHGAYQRFNINDPKARVIHKAVVRDRIVHHAIYRILYPLYDSTFIFDSYSCRLNKGTHRAVSRLEKFTRQVSRNYTEPCYALKCDVKKFFDSVDHEILFQIIERKIKDADTLRLFREIIDSYSSNLSTKLEINSVRSSRPLGSNHNIVQLQLFEKSRERERLQVAVGEFRLAT